MRWFVVDVQARTVLGGPYMWDGQSAWTPPVDGSLITGDECAAGGYTTPAPPPTVRDEAATYLTLTHPTAAQVADQVARLTRLALGEQ